MATRVMIETLQEMGFDRSYAVRFERAARVRCSQCEALVVNGHPIHERGCPNEPIKCRECGSMVPRGEGCSCVEDAIAYAEQEIEDGQARWAETGSSRRE